MKTNSQDIFNYIANESMKPKTSIKATDEEVRRTKTENENLIEAALQTQPRISKAEAQRRKYASNTNLGAYASGFLSSMVTIQGKIINRAQPSPVYPTPKAPIRFNFWQAILEVLKKIGT